MKKSLGLGPLDENHSNIDIAERTQEEVFSLASATVRPATSVNANVFHFTYVDTTFSSSYLNTDSRSMSVFNLVFLTKES